MKGCYLLLHEWTSSSITKTELSIDLKLGIEKFVPYGELELLYVTFLDLFQCLSYPVNDHIKRDNLFSLGTINGNTYLMQAESMTAREEWINTIHQGSG